MGVPGLWDLLRPAVKRTSLSTLSKEAFYANKNGLRGLTIGIDASIWIFHAQLPQHGENPFLRTIFYKITSLLQHPVLPVFVFDGPNKPSQKRNQNVAGQFGTADHRSKQFKALLNICGLEWWNAPGEAEAELAIMSRQGKIDAVLSDDVDALVFGATCLLRNNSPTLSGAQASAPATSRGDSKQYEMYRSDAIRDLWSAKEGTKLSTEEDCQMAMVLIALLSGGDYAPEGLPSIGPTISFGLANAGLSDFLKQYTKDKNTFDSRLTGIHSRIIDELRTNSTNQIGRKNPDRANKIAAVSPTSLFPEFTLDAYLNPSVSPPHEPQQGWPGFGKGDSSSRRGKARNDGRGDMEGFAKACEEYFEWGTKELVTKKFASEAVGIFGAQLMEEAREIIRHRGGSPSSDSPPVMVHQSVGTSQAASSSRITSFFQNTVPHSQYTSSSKASTAQTPRRTHIIRICGLRPDPTNADMNEYRIVLQPERYIQRCHNAMTGTRVDPKDLPLVDKQRLGLVDREKDREQNDDLPSSTQIAPNAKSEMRVWMAEYLVKEAWPDLVKNYEDEKSAKLNKTPKKAGKSKAAGKGKARSKVGGNENSEAFTAFFTRPPSPPTRVRMGGTSKDSLPESEEEEPIEWLPPRSRSKSGSKGPIDLCSSSPPISPRSRSASVPGLKVQNQGKKSKSRPHPTSSISSMTELESGTSSRPSTPTHSRSRSRSGPLSPSPTPRARPTTNKPRAKARRQSTSPRPTTSGTAAAGPSTSSAPGPTRKFPTFSNRKFTKSISSPSTFASPSAYPGPTRKGNQDQPIDLCSSSDEDPHSVPHPRVRRANTVDVNKIASPQRILGSSSKSNTLSPEFTPIEGIVTTPKPSGLMAKSSQPGKAKVNKQTRLNLPVIAGSPSEYNKVSAAKTNTPSISPTKTKTNRSSPKKRKPRYVVLSSNDEEELIDCI